MIGNRDPPTSARSLASEDLDLESLLAALGNSVRRQALRHLDSEEGRVELSTLAERIADADTGTEAEADTRGRERGDRLAIALHHNHLPKLADCGLVKYDPESRLVATAIPPNWAEPYLDLVEN